MEIIYRIFSGNHIIGYGIKDNLGNRINKSIQETIDLIIGAGNPGYLYPG